MTHVKLVVISDFTTSPFDGLYVKLSDVSLCSVVPTNHLYDAVPPFVGVAVYVTGVPGQTEFASSEI